jgi:hypothetical protein
MPMPVAMGPDNGTGGSAHCCPTPASDRTADDSTSDGAASRGALSHDIRYRHGKCQQQKN